MISILIFAMTAQGMFFGGGGGCGCRPQQCSCAPPPVQNFCPPSPCGRSFPTYPSYTPMAYRPPPPPLPQQYYSVAPQPIPIQRPFQNSYQQPILTSSYNAPPYLPTLNSYSSQFTQNSPVQVTAAKETTSDVFGDTVIQKSKTLSTVKNELDEDINALSNFETSLQAYKSMTSNGIRRAQGTKTEKPEKCSSGKLRQIMENAMTSSVSVSKLKISQGAKKEFGYNFDVICSQFDFSYLISSNIFCRVEIDGQTCLAYEN